MRSYLTRKGSILALALLGVMATATPADAITGGLPDTEHPNVGHVRFTRPDIGVPMNDRGECTGTLIADRVVLTAGHCIVGPGDEPRTDFYVSFNPRRLNHPVVDPSVADEYLSGSAYADPRWHWGNASQQPTERQDRGVIVLDGSAKAKWGIDPAPLPPEGFLDAYSPSQLKDETFTVVGYGVGEYLGHDQWVEPQERQFTTASFLNTSVLEIWLHINGQSPNAEGGGCFGDSGGPVYFEPYPYVLGDYSWTESLKCTARGVYSRTDTPAAREFLAQFVTLP